MVCPAASADDALPFFLKQPLFEFGDVQAGAVIDHVFEIENQSRRTIVVTKVKPACGCTTMGQWDETIAPGQTGKVPVKLDTAYMHGKLNKSIYIYLAASPSAPLVAQMVGSVFLAIAVRPAQLRFLPVRDRKSLQILKVRLTSNLEKPLHVALAQKGQGIFRTKLKTVRKGKEFELTVKTRPDLKFGWNKEALYLTTNISEQPRIEIPVYCYVHKPLECRPGVLTLPPGKLRHDIQKRVVVLNNIPGKFKDPKIVSSLPAVAIRWEATQREKEYRLFVRFPQGMILENAGQAVITIEFQQRDGSLYTMELPIEQIQGQR